MFFVFDTGMMINESNHYYGKSVDTCFGVYFLSVFIINSILK